jgi:hypothetical protein
MRVQELRHEALSAEGGTADEDQGAVLAQGQRLEWDVSARS